MVVGWRSGSQVNLNNDRDYRKVMYHCSGCTDTCTSSHGYGHSWAVDGQNKLTNHKGKTGEYKCDQCQLVDIIGLACDLDKMQMHVSLNGSFAVPQLVV